MPPNSCRKFAWSMLVVATFAVGQGSSCGAPIDLSTAIALDGTYTMVVNSAQPGSLLPAGTTGPVVITNGLLTSYLNQPVTNPQTPVINGAMFKWSGTVASPNDPALTALVTLDVTNQGGGVMTGTAFYTILGLATPSSTITMTKM
ncbi:MAG: hypothetical protein HZA51_04645 [Planctomycetes bacterium]|nr:hypothetical protein [Planctomycetota bacterium]